MRMMTKMLIASALAAAPSVALADTITYNDTPTATYFFGTSTNYSPANSAVLTSGGDQLFLRWHERYPQSLLAPVSNGAVYSFALGTQAPSFDFGYTSSAGLDGVSASFTVLNVGTGQTSVVVPISLLGGNVTQGNTLENSENLSFSFLSSVGFDPNVNDTYRVTLNVTGLASGSKSLSVDAQFGAGAVPEPATWAMMVGGFGLVGFAMRRRQRTNVSFA